MNLLQSVRKAKATKNFERREFSFKSNFTRKMYPSLPNQTLQTCETEWKHIINNNNTSLHIFQEICWSNLACPHVKRRIFHYKLLTRILIIFSWLPFSVFCVLSELFDLFENSGMYCMWQSHKSCFPVFLSHESSHLDI